MDIAQFQSPDFAGEVNFLAICQILNDKSPSTVGAITKLLKIASLVGSAFELIFLSRR
jgi:hypothetical protein